MTTAASFRSGESEPAPAEEKEPESGPPEQEPEEDSGNEVNLKGSNNWLRALFSVTTLYLVRHFMSFVLYVQENISQFVRERSRNNSIFTV